jgi:hypothetical protein
MPPYLAHAPRVSKRRLSPMIRQHEIMLDVLRNPALPETLQQLIDDSGTRKKWAANPLASARDAGFTLPEDAEVALDQFRGGWQVEVRVYEEPNTYIFGFNSIKGFYYK